MNKNSLIRRCCDIFFVLPRADFSLDNQNLIIKLRRIIPYPIRVTLKSIRKIYLDISAPIRIRKFVTKLLGPEFPPLHRDIEIDITYQCNLKCLYCNRFLDFAPSEARMSAGQIEKFIKESINLGRKWRNILVSGGEPTYHPQILEIANLLVTYKNGFSPHTQIWISTNGLDKHTNTMLSLLPAGIGIINSKKQRVLKKHYPVTVAPIDLKKYKNADFSNACIITHTCAMGLNLHGYYQCAVAAAMDTLLGLDLGRKKLPTTDDKMLDLHRTFCQYCGHFTRSQRDLESQKVITPSWQRIIDSYRNTKPHLSLY